MKSQQFELFDSCNDCKSYNKWLMEDFAKPEPHTRENNIESEAILEANRPRLTAQCKKILDLLRSGEKLTVRRAILEFGIGDLRRRIKDLIDSGIEIKSELREGRFKEWWIEC